MSVLIKGMKMPKNCTICRFCVPEADPENGEMCMATGKYVPPCSTERRDDCPLVEVPPHGRLIDGDNVIKLLREQLTGDRDTVYEYYDDGLEMAISELSIIPTIIEAEEGEA